jgi:serine/threonine protein kinase
MPTLPNGFQVVGALSTYTVTGLLRTEDSYTLYSCTSLVNPREQMLKVANSPQYNGSLDKESFTLRSLAHAARSAESSFAKQKSATEDAVFLNYHLAFPTVIETFVTEEEMLRIVVLAFSSAANVTDLLPLSAIGARDNQRIDIRASAWVLGKTLKIMSFMHSNRLLVGDYSGDNILLNPKEHYVSLFDFSKVSKVSNISSDESGAEILQSAESVFEALDGFEHYKVEQGYFAHNGVDITPYVAYLNTLRSGRIRSAAKAHEGFYAVCDSIWPRKFLPFTTYPL